jgi:hypothetical protein
MPLYASFAIPAGLLMWHKRSEVFLPRDRVFRLGPKVGYFCNAVTIVFAVFINIIFVFPATLPVQASNMSESIVCRQVMLADADFSHARLRRPRRGYRWLDGARELVCACPR